MAIEEPSELISAVAAPDEPTSGLDRKTGPVDDYAVGHRKTPAATSAKFENRADPRDQPTGLKSNGQSSEEDKKMPPVNKANGDQSPAFRADLKAQSKRRRERLSSLASAPPLRRRNDLLPPLVVEVMSPADLVSPARNVRRQEAAHIREVAASIAELGFCDPVLIGSGNTVLNGMIRVEAAKQLGLPRIPCIRVEHLTGSEQRLLRVALNRLGENGAWSLEDLKVEFEELIVEQTPIEISGFSAPEIDQILLGDDPPPHEQGPLAPAP
ncbi:MAG TPA: ParB N-terminal domain-containing protein, partial [Chthoniobacterales bacterium]